MILFFLFSSFFYVFSAFCRHSFPYASFSFLLSLLTQMALPLPLRPLPDGRCGGGDRPERHGGRARGGGGDGERRRRHGPLRGAHQQLKADRERPLGVVLFFAVQKYSKN